MKEVVYEEKSSEMKEAAKGKASKDCTHEELCKIYKATVSKAETPEERLRRINRFRCGW